MNEIEMHSTDELNTCSLNFKQTLLMSFSLLVQCNGLELFKADMKSDIPLGTAAIFF